MRLVILESPFSGNIERNIRYARLCVRHCLAIGESPIASHLLYTQDGLLDDSVAAERALGIAAGLSWYPVAEACVVYVDLGISKGMNEGMSTARNCGVPIEKRILPTWELAR